MRQSRRGFLGTALLGGALSLAGKAPRASAQAGLIAMMRAAIALGRRVRLGELSPIEWQDSVAGVLSSCSTEEIRDGLGVEALRARLPTARRGPAIYRLPIFEELGPDDGGAMRVFFFEAGRGDPPHCHFNSVTAHIVLAGEFRVRHYERLREEPGGFVLRPSHDRIIEEGDVTSISDLRDNAHWHHALTRGVLLDVEQGRLDPSIPPRRRQMLDPAGRALADGSILAPSLTRTAALRLYG